MTTTIQRAGEATTELVWYPPGGPFPINAQLVVGPEECVVASLNGVVLGVIQPGSHWLHPQPFPFLGPAVVGGTQVAVELWFVRTSAYAGLKFGGTLGAMLDAATNVEVAPRVMGEYSIVVDNPVTFVTTCMGQGASSSSGLVSWVSGVLLNHVKTIVERLVSVEEVGLMSRDIAMRVSAEVPPAMAEITAIGLAFGQLQSINLVFSEEDRAALTAVLTAKAAEKRAPAQRPAPSLACTRCNAVHAGGRFCTACGQPLPAA